MRFFALDTRATEKICKRYCTQGETEVLLTRYHWLSFLLRTFREFLINIVLLGMVLIAWMYEWPLLEIIGSAVALWVIFVLFRVLKAFIDWRYDFILVTTDKIVLVDQTSIFSRQEKPIHLENVGGIAAATQFWDIFPFGKITIHLKEGLGGDAVTILFVPHAQEVAATIVDVVTKYQRKGHTTQE
ncbi:MAG: hypothetical protein Greene041662_680 [Candidatus Peregrinibacteria bacterium Greene0416_62]|nr:MAG: hypothetical protein Greene041662_680 [Candidatus Peregrinibacteria bacterium Greene0416_62]TSC98329.1 MAG: hypothetical protein Greene101449_964 [Candidatus Peregrinibacteria bacterium Greene1014_49]